MKFTENEPGKVFGATFTLELSRRNLNALLGKLNFNMTRDSNQTPSGCTIVDPDCRIAVTAVENEEHYSDRPPGLMLDNETGKMT